MRVLHRVESGICGDDTASIDMPLPNRDGVTGVDIDVGIRVGWQIPKKKALALPVRAIYVPGVGAPGGIQTHNPWVRSLLVGMLFNVARYACRISHSAAPGVLCLAALPAVARCWRISLRFG